MGNEGTAELAVCELDSQTGRLMVKVDIHPKHVWETIRWTDYLSIPPVDNSQEIGIDLPVKSVVWSYDPNTGKANAGFEVNLGSRSATVMGRKLKWDFGKIKFSTEQVERLMEGDLSALTESVPNVAGITKSLSNDYEDSVRRVYQKYGKENVYFASKNPFVDECRPSKVGEIAVSLIASGGATADAIMRDLSSLAEGELSAVAQWLSTKGVASAETVAATILSGKGAVVPEYYLALKWMPIEYRSDTSSFGNRITPVIKETHGAFYIVVQPRGQGQSPDPDSTGYNQGPLAGVPAVPPVNSPQQLPIGGHVHEPVPYGDDLVRQTWGGSGVGVSDARVGFAIDIHNHTSRRVHAIVLRGGIVHDVARDPAPDWGLHGECIAPDNKRSTTARGVGERVVAVWDCETGQLIASASVVVRSNLSIVISEEANGRYFRIAAAMNYQGD